MDNIEDKINSILSNPQMMTQILSMAQAFNQPQSSETPQDAPVQPKEAPASNTSSSIGFDHELIGKIISATKQTGVDKNQQGLLKALHPYLSRNRIQKLEKAMRAARIAGFAAAALNGTGKGR